MINSKNQTPRTNSRLSINAQAALEFTFSIIIVLLLSFGAVRAFRWAGLDLAERRVAHENTLLTGVKENWRRGERRTLSPLIQLEPDFYRTKRPGMTFNNWGGGFLAQ